MKTLHCLFVGIFLLVISFPLIFIDRKSTVSRNENRILASFPQLIDNGKSNGEITHITGALDHYINDRFGFRDITVQLINTFKKSVKNVNGNVVIGKDDWLFYSSPDDGNNIVDFLKLNLFTGDEINQFMVNIEKRKEWCTNNDIKFIVLIAPNKHNVYPEYYPFERPDGITRTGQIISALPDSLNDVVIYPLDYLLQNKKTGMPLYFETDTHWNMVGAHYAFDLLFKKIKEQFPNTTFPEIDFTIDITYDTFGDIVPMSGFTSYGRRTIPNVHPVTGWEAFYQYVKNEGPNGVIIENTNKTLPKAIVFRDSFFTALEPFVSSVFSSVEYNWRRFNTTDKAYILKNKPDIIIWEIVERSITAIPSSAWN